MRLTRDGFTLIELMIVLTILAIVAGFAIPKVDFVKYRSDAAARGVIAQMQSAQRLAITRQHDVLVSFEATGRRFRVVEDANNNGRVDDGERTSWRTLQEETQFGTPATPVSLSGGAVVGRDLRTLDGMPTIVFRRDGSASGDAEIYLTSRRLRPTDFRAIVVTEATGRAEWLRWNGDAWTRGGL
jgi:prepilin-type N-terminal cleavage/methylation domain-containing protein